MYKSLLYFLLFSCSLINAQQTGLLSKNDSVAISSVKGVNNAADSIISIDKSYIDNVLIVSKYKNLELSINNIPIGIGIKSVKGIPYGDYFLEGKLDGNLLYHNKNSINKDEHQTIEVEVKNPHINGFFIAIPCIIAGIVGPVILTSHGKMSSAGGSIILVSVIGSIIGIKAQIGHFIWEKKNHALVDKLIVEE